MFVAITFTERILDPVQNLYKLTYMLEDTDFQIRLTVPIEQDIYDGRGDASIIPSGLINIYEQQKKNVPKNLALFYIKGGIGDMPGAQQKRLLYVDREWTEKYFPAFNYSKKYFNCVLNQMYLYRYTGVINAKPISGTVL